MGERVGAIIAAAGSGRRLGLDKMFAPLDGLPLIARTVGVFEACPQVDRIVLVLSQANLAQGQRLAQERGWTKVTLCEGGGRRQDSVARGLEHLTDCQWVVVHDGARPLVTADIICQGLVEARETGVAIAAMPAKETTKLVDGGRIVRETLPRQALWSIQTPQVFRYDLMVAAYQDLQEEVTDDASLLERLGHPVKVYPASEENIKITTAVDLELAEIISRRRGG